MIGSLNHWARSVLRRSTTITRIYRMLRIAGQVPFTRWLHLHRSRSIFRVLPHTMLSAPRLMNAYDCATLVAREGIDGDIAECGVWSGGCIGLMALASRRHSGQRTFHLFDSFEGLHQPSEHDVDVLHSFQERRPEIAIDVGGDSSALIATGACAGATREAVESFLTHDLDLDANQLAFHCGWFQDTIPAAADSIGPLAILRLDGDLYESTRVCLDHLYDRVVHGGFIIIDDYGTFEGCRRAVHGFFDARNVKVDLSRIDETGVYFRKGIDEHVTRRSSTTASREHARAA